MSPETRLRGVFGSCLLLGAMDIVWLDTNASRAASAGPERRSAQSARVAEMTGSPSVAATQGLERAAVAPAPTLAGPGSAPSPTSASFLTHFRHGEAVVEPGASLRLAPIAAALSSDPRAMAIVDGHCAHTGTAGINEALSLDRARAVGRELARLGVEWRRIRMSGFSDSRPVVEGTSEEAYRENRRVEVRVESTGEP
jgi:outer membrane protein OmpA-like peptidoglycan-associated protein